MFLPSRDDARVEVFVQDKHDRNLRLSTVELKGNPSKLNRLKIIVDFFLAG